MTRLMILAKHNITMKPMESRYETFFEVGRWEVSDS